MDSPSQPIILLFGMPRSGTTWVGKIFDSHPTTFYRHEPDSWGLLNAVPLLPKRENFADYQGPIRDFTRLLPGMSASKVNASLPIFPKQYYSSIQLQGRRLLASAAKVGARVFGEFPSPVLAGPRALATAPIVWKSIESVGRLGAIVFSTPGARAILLLRHPCGYVASVLRGEAKGRFTGSTPSSDDYGIFEQLVWTPEAESRGLTLERLKALTPVERLAWRWTLYNEKAMADIQGRSDCKTVRYEDICADPIGQVGDLFDFAELSWNEQTARFIEATTSGNRDSYYSLQKDPLKAANRWRDELSKEEQDRIMAVVSDSRPGRLYSDEALATPEPSEA